MPQWHTLRRGIHPVHRAPRLWSCTWSPICISSGNLAAKTKTPAIWTFYASGHQSVKSRIHFWSTESESSMGWESSAGAGLLTFALRSAPAPDTLFLGDMMALQVDRAQKAFHCAQKKCNGLDNQKAKSEPVEGDMLSVKMEPLALFIRKSSTAKFKAHSAFDGLI